MEIKQLNPKNILDNLYQHRLAKNPRYDEILQDMSRAYVVKEGGTL